MLGLGAALTAFLSHQSYKSGKPWFGSGSSIPAVTASSEDSGPEPVAAAPVAETPAAAPLSDTDSDPSFLKKIPLNCHNECLEKKERDSSYLCNKDCFTDWYFKCDPDCFKAWLNKPGNENLKSLSENIDTEDLYRRLNLYFPRCNFNESNDYCPDKTAEDAGTPEQRQLAINELFVAGMLSRGQRGGDGDRRRHKQKLQCINPVSDSENIRDEAVIRRELRFKHWKPFGDPDQDENGFSNFYDPDLQAEDGCTSNEDCSLLFDGAHVHPAHKKRLKDVAYFPTLFKKDHTCNACGRCVSTAVIGAEGEKIFFYRDLNSGACMKSETRCVLWPNAHGQKKFCKLKDAPTDIQAETIAECEQKYIEANGLAAAAAEIAAASSENAAPSSAPAPSPATSGGRRGGSAE